MGICAQVQICGWRDAEAAGECRGQDPTKCRRRLVATMTSRLHGFNTISVVIASTRMRGLDFDIRATSKISSHITMPWRCALDLVTRVRCLRGRFFAARMHTGECGYAVVCEYGSLGTAFGRPLCTAAARIFAFRVLADNDPVDAFAPTSGLLTPGSTRAGRTFAYWSKPWQTAAVGPTARHDRARWCADRAEENRIELLELVEPAFGNVVAGFCVLAAPRKMLDTELKRRRYRRAL